MVDLVALLEPAQDRDRVGDGGLADHHRLEAPLERGVLLDVLAVLVERRRADRAQFAAREHRLEQVGGVDGAFGGARADDRVQLVEEQDHAALRLGDLLEHRLQPVLELAAVLRAGDQRADVERDHAPVAQRLGHVAGDDPLGEALDDRRLADAGLADQHGVVLGAPREHLDHAADLLVAPDHRVELALLGGLRSGRVPKRSSAWYFSSGLWSVTRCEPRTSASACEQPLAGRADAAQRARRPGPSRRRARAAGARSRRTGRTSSPRLALGRAQHRHQLGCTAGRPRRHRARAERRQLRPARARPARAARQRGRRACRAPAARPRRGVRARQAACAGARGSASSAASRCSGRDLRVAALLGQARGCGERLLGLDGEAVGLHRSYCGPLRGDAGERGSGRRRRARARAPPR